MAGQQSGRGRTAARWLGLVQDGPRSSRQSAVDGIAAVVTVALAMLLTRGHSLWLRGLATVALMVVVALVVTTVQGRLDRRNR